ncbi:MAG TPA: transposase [Pirellulaceae bacterium]|nr:transposase [Pirellulaceae bacterium]HMO91979.1 transposase [Pirellulaceae bacterium]HMP68778.1 transposase [Pirellulaceae bacterium]
MHSGLEQSIPRRQRGKNRWLRHVSLARNRCQRMVCTLRSLRFQIVEPGRRTRTIEIITILTDADEFSREDIAQLYGFRWNSELDIRSIMSNMHLARVRCKSPEMVHREIWTTILGYNLFRTTAAGAALLHDKQPRRISSTSTCQ